MLDVDLVSCNKFNTWKSEVNPNPDFVKFILLASKMAECQTKAKPWEITLWLNENSKLLLSTFMFYKVLKTIDQI